MLKCKTKWSKMWGVSTDPKHPPDNANPAFIIASSADSEGRPTESCSYKPIIGSLAILCIGRLVSLTIAVPGSLVFSYIAEWLADPRGKLGRVEKSSLI